MHELSFGDVNEGTVVEQSSGSPTDVITNTNAPNVVTSASGITSLVNGGKRRTHHKGGKCAGGRKSKHRKTHGGKKHKRNKTSKISGGKRRKH